jgi:FMN reductase
MSTNRTAVLVVGNPRPGSRTRTVAEAVAGAVTASSPAGEEWSQDVVELADLAAGLLLPATDAVTGARQRVLAADLLVVASPVFKASYTGLLKAFLDLFGRDELAALPTVPVMVGASADHALAVETHLRPVLIEIGASCPTRGVFVVDSTLDTLEEQVGAWAQTWGAACSALVAARAPSTG